MIYQLASPPQIGGLYTIRNNTTPYVYVGASTNLGRRFGQWRGYMTVGLPVYERIKVIAPEADPTKWAFIVEKTVPDADWSELTRQETELIAEVAKKNGGKLLNVNLRSYLTIPGDTTILSDNGDPIPYDDAAKIAGYSKQSLLQALGRLRKKGVTTVNIGDLKNPGRGRPKVTP